MGWWTLAIFVASFILQYLLRPKPEIENAKAQKLGSIGHPRAEGGAPMSYIFGRVRLEGPSVMWYGDFSTRAIEKDDQIVGYHYFLGFQLGLCVGPSVVLKAIWIEDRQLFQSGPGVAGGTTFAIDQPNFFGGPDKGGGFEGLVSFYAGNNTQGQDSYLLAQLGSGVPSFPGFCYLVFRRVNFGTSPNLPRMSMTVERYPNNLGLGASRIIGDDLNPMEILYSALTEAWGGIGENPANIDTASFTTAAAVLLAEGNGMSLKVEATNTGKDIISEILSQVDGILYQNPETGKVVVSLIREDYTIGSLPVFDETNVESVENWTRTDWAELPNQVRIVFTDPLRTYKTSTAIVQDQAAIAATGKLNSVTMNFPGVTDGLLAVKIAHRELAQQSVPLYRANLVMNRKASLLRPGSPFVLNWPEYGLVQGVFRLQRYSLGELTDERVVAEVLQDKFAVSTQLYSEPEATLWSAVDRAAVNLTTFSIFEAPYMFIQNKAKWDHTFDPVDFPNSSWLYAGVKRINPAQLKYDVVTTTDGFVNDVQVDINQRAFANQATLKTAISAQLGAETGQIASLLIENIQPDTLAFLKDRADSDIRGTVTEAGKNWFVIGDEILAYRTFTDTGSGTATLEFVQRALLDTEFQDHLLGAAVYFIDNVNRGADLSRYERGDTTTIDFKLLSFTDVDAQDLDDVSPVARVFNNRYDRPLPPDFTRVELARWPLEIIAVTTLDVDWRERNKLDEPTSIYFVGDATDTPEAATTYNARLYIDNVLIESKTALASPSTSFSLNVRGWGDSRVEVEAVKGGLVSWTSDKNRFFFANYLNLGSELFVNGRIESALGAEWSTQSGTWARIATLAPLYDAYDINNLGDNDHLEATGSTNEIRQDITIGGASGQNAMLRCWRASKETSHTGQLIVELRDGGGALKTITTPVRAATTLNKWERVEINLPLRTDATIVRTRVISAGPSMWDMFSLRACSASIASTVFYNSLGSVTSVKAAWGKRKMISTYSGALIRILDTADNSEQDVGSDPNGNLEPFHVTGEARLIKIYDQTGNGSHLESFKTGGHPQLWHMATATGRSACDFFGSPMGFRDQNAPSGSRPYMIARPNAVFVCGIRRGTGVAYNFHIPDQTPSPTSLRWGLLSDTEWDLVLNDAFPAGGAWAQTPQTDGNVIFLDYQSGATYHNDDVTPTDTFTAADVTYPGNTRLYLSGRESASSASNIWDAEQFHELCVFEGTLNGTDRGTIMDFLRDYWFNL